jgi:hypothetical protein
MQISEYQGTAWLGDLYLYISYPAMALIWEQGKWARAADPSLPRTEPLQRECTQRFYQQYGLPCSHVILACIIGKTKLQKEQIHPRWWLRKPISYDDEIRRVSVRDPAVVESIRPRLSNNKKNPVPQKLELPGYMPTAPPATQGRGLPASITRDATQAEMEEAFATQQATQTRGRGTRGQHDVCYM